MKNRKHKHSMEESFLENNLEAISAMTNVIATQQSIAFDLTKLVLEYGVDGKITKDEIFEIYEEACNLLREQPDE